MKKNLVLAVPALIGMGIVLCVAFSLEYMICAVNYRVAQDFSKSPIIR